jgi:hypothetical protein
MIKQRSFKNNEEANDYMVECRKKGIRINNKYIVVETGGVDLWEKF